MKDFLHKLLVFFSLFFVVGLLLSYLSVYVNPQTVSIVALFGLAYPYFLFINVLFFFYWVYRKRLSFLVPLFAILLGWPIFTTYFSIGTSNHEVISKDIKLLSYNVRYFNRYEWNKNPQTADNILSLANKSNVDIICFQEFILTNTKKVSDTSVIKALKAFPYHFINKRKNLAIFSKFKILDTVNIKFKNSTSAVAFYADLKIGGQKIRVFNCHLESNKFKREDYDFINNLTHNAEEKNIDGAKGIIRRLMYAFVKRSHQAEMLNEMFMNSPYKPIVCMDMNDSPVSYSYRKLNAGLHDSFLEKGTGIGTTYVGDFPSYRIDYVFHHPDIECLSYKRIKEKFSDHYPLIVGFRNDF